jgi:poly(3-hydroxybutyrate) depolymerase
MRSNSIFKAGLIAGLAVGVQIVATQVTLAQQPAPQAAPATGGPQAGRGGGARGGADPRVQQRTYTFADTGEMMPYGLFVSSKVSKDKKAPLIVSLHGLGGDQNTMVRESSHEVDLAEDGGYILVTPMGYSSDGWYGIPVGAPRAGGAPAAPARGAANGAPAAGAGGRGAGGGRGAVLGGQAITDAPKKREASEKDTMAVIDMVRKEFNIDDRRMYLMGHSMGGAGTYFLGSKYANLWAAISPIAPAAMSMNNDRAKVLQGIKDAKVPMFVIQGDADEAVPIANTRMWVDTMKEMKMDFEYKEVPGVTHGPIIGAATADVFAFFAKHTKPASR